MFLNNPTRVFKFFVFSLLSPSSLILLKRLFSNSVLKVLRSEIQKSMYQKNCSLPVQVWLLVTIIIHLFVLDDFIFKVSHEECDITKFSQLNGAAWILSGELSSVFCVCEYLSRLFIRITTVKGVTSIERIKTVFCLWSLLIIFTKQPTDSMKIQKWLN